MKVEGSYIVLRDVRFYAFHGVLPQERRVGGYYLLNLRVGYPMAQAMIDDDVNSTLNYAALYELVKREMQEPSNLLEHVAGRIAKAIEKTFPQVSSIDLTLIKENPPMGADSNGAGVEVHFVRGER